MRNCIMILNHAIASYIQIHSNKCICYSVSDKLKLKKYSWKVWLKSIVEKVQLNKYSWKIIKRCSLKSVSAATYYNTTCYFTDTILGRPYKKHTNSRTTLA